jgi:pyruvate/2-oxoglutarate dehydrogenase complex dihydrolipoamide dehydrogenase (E3) component
MSLALASSLASLIKTRLANTGRLLHTMSSHYDAIIVGSGQCGTPLASAFAAAGKRTAMIEREHIGGTCVNVGCTPTKTMIASGRAAYMARRAGDYGVTATVQGIDMARVRQRKREMVKSWNAGGESRLRKNGVDIIMGTAQFTGEKKLTVKLNDGGEKEITGDVVILDVGERPAKVDLPGLDDIDAARVLDSTSVMELGEVPESLIVLGGGYIGLEFGQLFRRLGAKVTVIQRAKQLAPREDEDIAKALLEIFQQDGIEVHLSTNTTSVETTGDSKLPIKLTVKGPQGDISISGSHILCAAGRTPNTDTLNLPAVGIRTTPRGHLIVDSKLQTSAAGVYGLGDAHGGAAFTHMSYDDFRIMRANLLPSATPSTTPPMATTEASVSRRLVPYVMYTDPQLGHVGLHARDLAGRNVKTATMPMGYVARATETDEPRGLMKATVDAETGEILGFTCLGIEGGEVMAIVQTAMMGGLKWWDLKAAVWAHPSLAESLNNLWGYLE